MKKNIMRFMLFCGLLLITGMNYWIYNQTTSDVTNLFLANIESLAGEESNTMRQSTTSNDCTLSRRVIKGYDSQGRPNFTTITVSGSVGICSGPDGACNPWPCTEDLTRK